VKNNQINFYFDREGSEMMIFLKDVPNIKIIKNDKYIMNINTVQKFIENDNKVIMQCAEDIPMFTKGYVCDMECYFNRINDSYEYQDDRINIIKDLVLVYINKNADMESLAQFEYIFYK
jgi:putative lipase involved disintegration of autophagic bodies